MSDHGVTGTPPARLSIGLVSAGRVGTAVGAALERRGHVVSALVARSAQSRDLAARRLPEARITDPADAAAAGELLILAVPDSALSGVVAELAERIGAGEEGISGVMVESFLEPGAQSVDAAELVYGKSVTDACIGWDTTEEGVRALAAGVRAGRRG